MSDHTLIILLFIATNFLLGFSLALLDSRNYWRRKWEEDEDYILYNIRGNNDN